jgi:hypothetical protein
MRLLSVGLVAALVTGPGSVEQLLAGLTHKRGCRLVLSASRHGSGLRLGDLAPTQEPDGRSRSSIRETESS